jgi:hypothetical protein
MVVTFVGVFAWRVLYLRRKQQRMHFELQSHAMYSPRGYGAGGGQNFANSNSGNDDDDDDDDDGIHPEDAALLP